MLFFIKGLFTIQFWREFIYKHRKNSLIWLFNKTVRAQKRDTSLIPIIIINYNRLKYLEELVYFLISREHKNIIIIDNKSSYPPLLEYYKTIQNRVTIEYMDQNYGHMVFWINDNLYRKYSKGYYIITDSDIIPNSFLPLDYIRTMRKFLDKNKDIVKVGFALRIDDIPDSYKQKQNVIEWEKQFWQKTIEKDIYKAKIDTTFAIYPPRYKFYNRNFFYQALRLGDVFTAKHGGWYIDNENLSEEDKFYFYRATTSSSWRLDENGNFSGRDFYVEERI